MLDANVTEFMICVYDMLAVVVLSIHPSKFLIPEEEDDGRGGRRRQMAAAEQFIQMFMRLLIG
jgi:hypothetical protein